MDISVIIINYNTKDLLRNSLNSVIRTFPKIPYEIIVVDNASHDGSLEMLKSEFCSSVTILENKSNRGFGAANNQAFKLIRGRYALLLNTDTILAENAVQHLYDFMESHPECGMACGQLLNSDGSKQNSIAKFPSIWTLLLNTSLLEYLFPNNYPSKRYPHKFPIEIDSGVGACLLVRQRIIEEVGDFDERYFFFFEETDWAMQIRRGGWKIYFIPDARIYHLQGQSVGKSINSRILFYRSRYQFIQKWNGRFKSILISVIVFLRLTVNWVLTTLGTLLTAGCVRSLRTKWVVYSQLIRWHLRGCP